MALNRKLIHLLKGRTIQSESGDEGHVAITFDDESTLKLRVAGQATVRVGAKVEAVHEAGEHFQVDLRRGPQRAGTACRSGIVGGVARQMRRDPIPRLMQRGARTVVAIIRCHSKWKKQQRFANIFFPTKRRQRHIVAKPVVFATH